MQAAKREMPIKVAGTKGTSRRYTERPKPTARAMNIRLAVAVSGTETKVMATALVNTPMTRISAEKTNSRNRVFMPRPTRSSRTEPSPRPSWRTLMISAEKSCTAPMNTPPTRIHSSTAVQP